METIHQLPRRILHSFVSLDWLTYEWWTQWDRLSAGVCIDLVLWCWVAYHLSDQSIWRKGLCDAECLMRWNQHNACLVHVSLRLSQEECFVIWVTWCVLVCKNVCDADGCAMSSRRVCVYTLRGHSVSPHIHTDSSGLVTFCTSDSHGVFPSLHLIQVWNITGSMRSKLNTGLSLVSLIWQCCGVQSSHFP